jgi:hypothetical protein
MKKLSGWALALVMLAAPAMAGEWTGYLTDTHCGPKMASKDHTEECVQKCVKGGSKVHIVDADKKMYDLDSYDKVKGLVGKKITVKGTLDPATNTITVDSAAPAAKDAK